MPATKTIRAPRAPSSDMADMGANPIASHCVNTSPRATDYLWPIAASVPEKNCQESLRLSNWGPIERDVAPSEFQAIPYGVDYSRGALCAPIPILASRLSVAPCWYSRRVRAPLKAGKALEMAILAYSQRPVAAPKLASLPAEIARECPERLFWRRVAKLH